VLHDDGGTGVDGRRWGWVDDGFDTFRDYAASWLFCKMNWGYQDTDDVAVALCCWEANCVVALCCPDDGDSSSSVKHPNALAL